MWLPAPCEWLDPPPWECELLPESLLLLSDDFDSEELELEEPESESDDDDELSLLEELPFDLLPGAEPDP